MPVGCFPTEAEISLGARLECSPGQHCKMPPCKVRALGNQHTSVGNKTGNKEVCRFPSGALAEDLSSFTLKPQIPVCLETCCFGFMPRRFFVFCEHGFLYLHPTQEPHACPPRGTCRLVVPRLQFYKVTFLACGAQAPVLSGRTIRGAQSWPGLLCEGVSFPSLGGCGGDRQCDYLSEF